MDKRAIGRPDELLPAGIYVLPERRQRVADLTVHCEVHEVVELVLAEPGLHEAELHRRLLDPLAEVLLVEHEAQLAILQNIVVTRLVVSASLCIALCHLQKYAPIPGALASPCYDQLLPSGGSMTDALQGKVCLVTGASSGIGEATALRLSEAGAAVALAARREERLRALADRIDAGGGRALALTADVADESQARQAVERAASELGGLDVLVNNAGVMLLGPVAGADTSEWRRMVDVNVLGLLYCTHAALPIMGQQGSGHIVNISSVAGRTTRAGVAVYNATKWAVCAFSDALRQEVLHANVRVTVIEPGVVKTELGDHVTHPLAREAIERMRTEMKAPLEADDIARSILYAVSEPQHVSVNEVLVRPTEQER